MDSRTNLLIESLPPKEAQELRSMMQQVALNSREILYEPRQKMEKCIFPIDSLISIVAETSHHSSVEVGTIGREGFAGISALFDSVTPYRVSVQIPGDALVVERMTLLNYFHENLILRKHLLKFAHAFLTKLAQSAVCHAFHSVEEKLARWLLDSQDAVRKDVLPFTHEILGLMLGVRRVTVTLTLGNLQKAGMIDVGRGKIKILDRTRLEELTCECHEIVKKEFQSFLPNYPS